MDKTESKTTQENFFANAYCAIGENLADSTPEPIRLSYLFEALKGLKPLELKGKPVDLRASTEYVRSLEAGEKRDEAKRLRTPAAQMNGAFPDVNGRLRQARNADFLENPDLNNGLIQIDIDNKGDVDELARAKAKELFHTLVSPSCEDLRKYIVFAETSISGRGVVLFFLASPEAKRSEEAFKRVWSRCAQAVSAFLKVPFEAKTGLFIDKSTTDFARKRILAFDENALINLDALPFPERIEEIEGEEIEGEEEVKGRIDEDALFFSTSWGRLVSEIGGRHVRGVERLIYPSLFSSCLRAYSLGGENKIKSKFKGESLQAFQIAVGVQGGGKTTFADVLSSLLKARNTRVLDAKTTACLRNAIRDEATEIFDFPTQDGEGKTRKKPIIKPLDAPKRGIFMIIDEGGDVGTSRRKSQHGDDLQTLRRKCQKNSVILESTTEFEGGSFPVKYGEIVLSTPDQFAKFHAENNDNDGDGRRYVYAEIPTPPKKLSERLKAVDSLSGLYDYSDTILAHLDTIAARLPSGDVSFYAPDNLTGLVDEIQEYFEGIGWTNEAELFSQILTQASINAVCRFAFDKGGELIFSNGDKSVYPLTEEDFRCAQAVLTASYKIRMGIRGLEKEAEADLLKTPVDKARALILEKLEKRGSYRLADAKKKENDMKAIERLLDEGEVVIDTKSKAKVIRLATEDEKAARNVEKDAETRQDVKKAVIRASAAHGFAVAKASGDVLGMKANAKKYVDASTNSGAMQAKGGRHIDMMRIGGGMIKNGLWTDEGRAVLALAATASGLPSREIQKSLRDLDRYSQNT